MVISCLLQYNHVGAKIFLFVNGTLDWFFSLGGLMKKELNRRKSQNEGEKGRFTALFLIFKQLF